jgi:hypothetical protein
MQTSWNAGPASSSLQLEPQAVRQFAQVPSLNFPSNSSTDFPREVR